MRTLDLGALLSSGLLGVLALHVAGCFGTRDDCAQNPLLSCGPWTTHKVLPPECSGDPTAKNVIEACGVFVQADAMGTTEDGSKANPYKTLQKAIDGAAGKRVYACTSKPFIEAVTITSSVEMYGGFDCTKGWAWSQDRRSALNGPADAVALTIETSAGGTKVEGFAITAASAGKAGGSSIAVAVDDVAAELVRCDVKAGDAAAGMDGQKPSGTATQGADAAMPDATTMKACIALGAVMGGAPGVTICEDGATAGGLGGKGGITGTINGDGQPGAEGSLMGIANGLGGAGESATTCVSGGAGKDGDPGPAGPGGSAPGLLTLSGITIADNTDGLPGTKAQGGGGGGGAKAGTFCPAGSMTIDGVGASGGGGGAGGCGGKGGGGGKAGGSSLAIVSLGTNLVLTDVTLAVGKAGKGGTGVAGQSGGAVGAGVFGGAASGTSPSKPGCKGGDGGTGGDGGPGGGGRGGHAIGLAYAKALSPTPTIKTFTPGTPGNGGTAGTGATTSNGASGASGQCWDFGIHAACL